LEVTLRNLLFTDWVVVLYIIVLLLLVTAKTYSDYKFSNFSKLILTDTYLKTYRDDSLLKPFHVFVIASSVLFFPLAFQTLLFRLGFLEQFLFFDYFKITLIFTAFYFLKMLLQLIVVRIFGEKSKIEHYVFEKQTYFSYLVFFSLLPVLFFIYVPFVANFWVYSFVFLWFILFLLSMVLVIFHFKELFFSHLLYFILYLCTFEICPLVGAIFYLRRL